MILGVKKRLLFVGLLFLVTIAISGTLIAAQASDARDHILQASDKAKSGEYVRQRFFKQMKRPFIPTDKRKKMLIIGDSHAQDFYNALLENNLNQRYQISTRRIPAICGLYLGSENISGLIEKKHVPICQKADTLASAMPQIKQADVGGQGGEPLIKGQTFMAMFNSHTHVCTAPGSPSGPPLPPLTPAALTLAAKAK